VAVAAVFVPVVVDDETADALQGVEHGFSLICSSGLDNDDGGAFAVAKVFFCPCRKAGYGFCTIVVGRAEFDALSGDAQFDVEQDGGGELGLHGVGLLRVAGFW